MTEHVSPADRIRALSSINEDVAAMLSSAGKAINALTNRPLTSRNDDEDTLMTDDTDSDTIEARNTEFKDQSKAYLTNFQTVIAQLRKQAYALEEAGIIAPLPAYMSKPQANTGMQQRGGPIAPQPTESELNGGLGKFDVGWLNSRGNKVGAEKEAELIQEAKELLEQEIAKKEG